MQKTLTFIFIVLAVCLAVSQERNDAQEHEKLLQRIKDFENSSKFGTEILEAKNKKPNQVNTLPPDAPTVWDTILWDEPTVLLTNFISSMAYMQGRVGVDDSGNVHVASLMEDAGGTLRYHRSTDYGVTFAPAVALDSPNGSVIKVIATESKVYIYTYASIFSASYDYRLYTSLNKGISWNPVVYAADMGGHSTFGARSDSAYAYMEGTTIYQGRSYNAGASFGAYTPITNSSGGSSIQSPDVAVGGNTLCYVRFGDLATAYRSFDLGNTWQPALNITPIEILQIPNAITEFPRVFYRDEVIHNIQKSMSVYYTKSIDYGNSFLPFLTICNTDSLCVSDWVSQISSHGTNVFINWKGSALNQSYKSVLRFSRDNGNTWSKHLLANSQIPGFTGMGSYVSVASDDSLVYVVYVQGIPGPIVQLELAFRRGFYKYPLCYATDVLHFGVVDSSADKDTTLVIRNRGTHNLVISNITYPLNTIEISNLNFPLTVLPDSVLSLPVKFKPQFLGGFEDTIRVFHNQQVDNVKEIRVAALIVTDLTEHKNNLKTFKLFQNYPNPFNPNTRISFELPKSIKTGRLTIFNILGKEVKKWDLDAKSKSVVWNGTDSKGNSVSSGIYFYQLQAGEFQATKKMVLLK